jgi:hypothetical protein
MRIDRRGTRAAALVGIASLSLLVSACGGSNGAVPPTTPAKPTTTTGAPPTTTTDPTTTAVLQAYRASWSAFENALADADPSAPELTATMVDPQLEGVKANLLADQRQGIVGRGTFELHPKITSLTATTATIVDCAYSTSVLVYASTGKPVPPITPPENDGVQSSLVLTGSTWKVAKQNVTDGSCAPGS